MTRQARTLLIALLTLAAGTAVPAQTIQAFEHRALPLEPINGNITLAAQSAEAWTFTSTDHPDTRRILLRGDVSIQIATTAFQASRAAVWIQTIADDAGNKLTQVFCYAEGVDTPSAEPSVSITAESIAIEGVLSDPTAISLSADSLKTQRREDTFTLRAENAFDRRFADERARAQREAAAWTPADAPADLDELLAEQSRGRVDLSTEGTFAVSAGSITYRNTKDGPAAILTGDVIVEYSDLTSAKTLQLTAERAVVFLDRAASSQATSLTVVPAADVEGIYLEGGVVATDGSYTLRGNRIYYSVPNDRALVLDAVFNQYNPRLGTPLYVRASAIRQLSPDVFKAENARFSTAAFFRPQLALGASSVTITLEDQQQSAQASQQSTRQTTADARNLTVRAANVPFLYFPLYKGDPERFPLENLSIENDSENGETVRTRWDLLALLGIERKGLDVQTLFDVYTGRGPGLGADIDWTSPNGEGNFFVYSLFNDTGVDDLSTGIDLQQNGDQRLLILGDYQAKLGDRWSIFLEASYVSDPTFIDALFEDIGQSRREFRSGATLVRREDNTQGSIELSGPVNDFAVNQYILTTDAYQVDKLPEGRYSRVADDLLKDLAPGFLTSTFDASLGINRLRLTDRSPAELGFNNSQSLTAFGINADQNIADTLRDQGLFESAVTRLDVREEIAAHLKAGPVDITPFVVARATTYDSNFEQFSPQETQPYRIFGAAGVTASTRMQRVYNNAQSDLFNVHRLRHIIEPSATIYTAGTSIDQEELPVFDDDVESIAEGTQTSLALDQTFQTQRGGPGRYESVDLLKLRLEYTDASGETQRESPIARFFDARPENSQAGESIGASTVWQASNAVAITGGIVHNLETNQNATANTGITLRHSPLAVSTVELRSLNEADAVIFSGSTAYELTEKYTGSASTSYDTRAGTLQTVSGQLVRRFQAAELGLGLAFNNIRGNTSFLFVVRPVGARSSASFSQSQDPLARNRSGIGR